MAITRRAVGLGCVGGLIGGLAGGLKAGDALAQAAEPLRTFTIPSGSMEPNLQIGDVVLTRWTGRPGAPALQRGDVIIFRREGRFWVKRIIGLPGDEVALRRGVVSVNGAALARIPANGLGRREGPRMMVETLDARRYRILVRDPDPKRARAAARLREMAARRVPADGLFVMGDNRDDSYDSRDFGMAPIADVRFVAVQVLFSRDASRIGFRLDLNVA